MNARRARPEQAGTDGPAAGPGEREQMPNESQYVPPADARTQRDGKLQSAHNWSSYVVTLERPVPAKSPGN